MAEVDRSNSSGEEYEVEDYFAGVEVEEEFEEEEDEVSDGRAGSNEEDGECGGGGGEDSPKPFSCDGGGGGDPKPDSEGKVFVGGISWETTGENFAIHFQKYGKITDAIIMRDKHTGMPRGFGFVTFADPSVLDGVLRDVHVIDGRTVEVKQTVPRETMAPKTKKLFVGGIPPSLIEDEFEKYFAAYGKVVEHQIMVDHITGRSRGFGFITFESEHPVEEIMSLGITHELDGKQVELRRAMPKKAVGGGDSSGYGHGGGNMNGNYRTGGGGNMYGNYRTGRGGYGGYDGGGHQSRGGFGGRGGGRANMSGIYDTGHNYSAPYGYGMGFAGAYGGVPLYGMYDAFFNLQNGYAGQGSHGSRGSRGGGGGGGGGRGQNGVRYKPYH